MILSRTPFRVSFFGGGTDYPAWYRQHGGAVLTATIDKYCYLTCRYLPPFFEHRIRVVYSRIECCNDVDEIAHPAVRETLRFLEIRRGVEIHHDGDLPARSGMGSSSSFTVGLLHALHALQGRTLTRSELAQQAMFIEQERLSEHVGSQDQVAAAFGGLNHVRFQSTGGFSVEPVAISAERLTDFNAHLMLYYTGIKRTASEVAGTYASNLDRKHRQLRTARSLVGEGLSVLGGRGELLSFGELLHEAWSAKREMSPRVSSAEIDSIYAAAREAGALGGKLLGAGGGGFMLLFVPPSRRAAVRERLRELIHVPFKFEFSGSQIVLLDRESDYTEEDRARATEPPRKFRERADGEAGARI